MMNMWAKLTEEVSMEKECWELSTDYWDRLQRKE